MIFIRHRTNKVSVLKQVHPTWGVEIDLRSKQNQLDKFVLCHDPWNEGDDFDEWLSEFKVCKIKGPIILNTKEDGLETSILKKLKKADIQNFFFLDTTIPSLVKWALNEGVKNFALRISKYEPIECLNYFKGKVEWVWLDCFSGNPVDISWAKKIKNDYKLCLVSPELHRQKEYNLEAFRSLFVLSDAVCTKSPMLWQDIVGVGYNHEEH